MRIKTFCLGNHLRRGFRDIATSYYTKCVFDNQLRGSRGRAYLRYHGLMGGWRVG